MGWTREQRAERERERNATGIERVPVGAGNKLAFEGTDPDYMYRIVNDRPGRIPMFIKAGYEFCADETRVQDNGIAETSQLDTRKSLDLGGGDKGYLMRIRKEYFDEDQAAKIDNIRNIEKSMQRTPTSDNPNNKGLTYE